MGWLLNAALEPRNLEQALDEVAANDIADGSPSRSVSVLVDRRESALPALRDEVTNGLIEFASLTAIRIPKPDGGERELHLPSARDRVLERALLQVLAPILDPLLGDTSFAYREGIGIGHAVRSITGLREEGLRWVARTDIDDCFPSIDRAKLLRLLSLATEDEDLVRLVGSLLARPVRLRDRLWWPDRGVPQGSPLSPVLSNLYLAQLDTYIIDRGFPLVRYADDLVLLAESRSGAESALLAASEGAQELGLRLGVDKTEIVDFETGFCFLGEDFNHRYPPDVHLPTDDPARRTLYIGVQGAYLSMQGGRLVSSRKKAELLSVPSGHVARIVIFGSVTLSPAVLSWAPSNDVEVVVCSRRGGFIGWMSPAGSSTTATRRKQFAVSDDLQLSLGIGASMLKGKLHNQRSLLRRRIRPQNAAALRPLAEQIAGYIPMLSTATTRDELLGVEGIAAKAYFEAVRELAPADLGFKGRRIRPPADVVNAALSYGYAILVGECTTALAAAGLDPAVGLLHVDSGSRPSLALDLAEEFRPLIVDSVVLTMVIGGQLTAADGRSLDNEKGVLLTEDGRRRLIAAVETRLLTLTHHLASHQRTSYRRCIFLQAQMLARLVRTGETDYQPMLWRV